MNDHRVSDTLPAARAPFAGAAPAAPFTPPAAPEPVGDPDPGDVAVPPGRVLRYCGIEKRFFYADPADKFCLCGYAIGAV